MLLELLEIYSAARTPRRAFLLISALWALHSGHPLRPARRIHCFTCLCAFGIELIIGQVHAVALSVTLEETVGVFHVEEVVTCLLAASLFVADLFLLLCLVGFIGDRLGYPLIVDSLERCFLLFHTRQIRGLRLMYLNVRFLRIARWGLV